MSLWNSGQALERSPSGQVASHRAGAFASVLSSPQPSISKQSGRQPRLDEAHCAVRLLYMDGEVAHLRSQASRCRRLAESVSTDQDQAMLRRLAKDFDEAADELEKKKTQVGFGSKADISRR